MLCELKWEDYDQLKASWDCTAKLLPNTPIRRRQQSGNKGSRDVCGGEEWSRYIYEDAMMEFSTIC